MDGFEYDPDKNRSNLQKHRIDFDRAKRIWEGPVIEFEDIRFDYGERRFIALGAVEDRIVVVVFTWRGANRRLIRQERQIRMSAKPMKRPSRRSAVAKTNWHRFDASTDRDIAAAVATDPDAAPLLDSSWLKRAKLVMPPDKESISIRLDKDVLDHFRARPRYQSRINAILRLVMEEEKTR